MSRWSASGRPYRRLRARFLAEHTVYWWCGDGGADEIDHVIAASTAPHGRAELATDPRSPSLPGLRPSLQPGARQQDAHAAEQTIEEVVRMFEAGRACSVCADGHQYEWIA